MSKQRPYVSAGIEQLESLVKVKRGDLAVLRAIRDELKKRRTRRAKELLGLIERLLTDAPNPVRQIRERVQRTTLKQASSLDWVNALYCLEPSYFERVAIGAFNKLLSFQLRPTPRTGDGGIDGVGSDPSNRKTVLQAKRWNPMATIGPDEMRAFVGAMVEQHHPQLGVFVTTANFSKGARDIAERQGIQLFDGERLSRVMEAAKQRYDVLVEARSKTNPLSK